MASEPTTLFRARVPASRLRKAEEILARLGMKPGDAFNMLLAQIELREGLPFEVTTRPPVVLNSEQQAAEWQEALGGYERQGRDGSPQPSGA
jgi:addiction module RelB/DinJ family antitoxin